jgi:RND superfamily putative drug exporter
MTATSRFARALVRLRFVVVLAWVAAAVAATALLPTLDEAQTGALGDLVPNDAAALDAELRAYEAFGFPLLSRTVLVQRDADGLSAGEQARVVQRALALNRDALPGLEGVAGALPVTNAIGAAPFTRERSTTAITFLLFGPEVDRRERERLTDRLVRLVEEREDHQVALTGALAAREAQSEAITDALPFVELATLVLVALVVGLHFRAPLAPVLVLAGVAVAYLISVRLMAGIGERLEVSVPAEVEPVVVVLLFGVITDYSIFVLSRLRRRLAEAPTARAAVQSTVAELQGVILTAGLIVVLASSALVVAELGFIQAFGPGLALAVLVALAVALTLVPALLAILGPAVFWPARPRPAVEPGPGADRPPARPRPARSRLVRLAARRPVATIALTSVVLLAAASGMLRLDVGQTLIRGLPPEAQARQGYVAAAQGFAPGILSPTVVLVEGEGIVRERAALARLQRALAAREGVAQVVGPRQQPLEQPLGAVLAPGGDAVRLLLVLDSDPLGARAIATVEALRRDLPALLDRVGLEEARASVAGDTALSAETVREAADDLGRIAPAVLLVVFVVLAVFLRALVAPLYLVGASVLALGAALGLTAYVFQELLGHGELTFYVPFAAAVLLVALGSDYNVFLAGRIWREARERPWRDAVEVGGARAATAITIAGLVLALSFALLALVPLRAFRELAFAMAAGLLIDAFVVRTLLVPALIALVGPVSGWPGRRLGAAAGVAAGQEADERAAPAARTGDPAPDDDDDEEGSTVSTSTSDARPATGSGS